MDISNQGHPYLCSFNILILSHSLINNKLYSVSFINNQTITLTGNCIRTIAVLTQLSEVELISIAVSWHKHFLIVSSAVIRLGLITVEYWYVFEQPGMEHPTPSIIWSFIYFNLTTQVDFDVFSLYSVNITYFMCFKCIQFLYST
jgi:hypothetical protein